MPQAAGGAPSRSDVLPTAAKQLKWTESIQFTLGLPKAELGFMGRRHRIVNLVSQEWACSSGSEFIVFGGI